MTFLALPWFVLATTGSATRMGVVLAVELAPVALLGIPSGAVVARLGARRTMQVADLMRVPLMCAIPILHTTGHLSFGVLLVLVFAIGCFLAPYFSSQRVILPELVGDDEQTVAQANAVIEGATQLTSLLGPAVAGLLIAVIGATNVLYVDAATFLFSFLTVTAFVPRRPPVARDEESSGVFAGLRFLARDPLLWRIGLAAVFLNMFGQILSASLPVLAFEQFGESARIAGGFFACFGGGALVGMVLTFKLVEKVAPLKLAAFGIVAMMLPLWLLGLDLPAWAIMAVLFGASIPQPLVNAPLFGVLTSRTPEALRPKVMTALITVALLAGPIGLLIAGPLLEALGPRQVFLIIAGGQTVFALFFAWVALRFGGQPSEKRNDVSPVPSISA
jgi:MFS family permease